MAYHNRSCWRKSLNRASLAVLALAFLITNPVLSEERYLAGAEEFNQSGQIEGSGYANVYDPVNNTLQLLPYLEIDGMAIHDGDVMLGSVSDIQGAPVPAGSGVQNGVALNYLGSRWDDGIVYYDLNGHAGSATILAGMADIEAKTSIRFVVRTNQTSYLRFINGSGCWSYIGKRNGVAQDISLQSPGCVFRGVAEHEIFHALGVFHEQSRNDRDTYVTINFGNVRSGFENNFQKAGNGAEDIGPYDYSSIMHYGKTAFSVGGDTITTIPPGIPIGNRTNLSDGDILTIQSMYYTDLSLDLNTVNSVNPGAALSLTVTVDNPGNDANIGSIIAKDVKVTLPLPNQATYSGFSSSDSWSCQTIGQNIECDLAILGRNADTTLNLNFIAPINLNSVQFNATVNASNRDLVSNNDSDSATVTISGVANNSPDVSITSPANNSSFVEGAGITLRGTASDNEDGNISHNIVWSSNRDGSLGTGASRSVSNLSVGTHTITASITDSASATDTATRTITVTTAPNTPPTVSISSPGNGNSFVQGASISFSGNASDDEDGNLSTNIVWTSSRDGNIGSGASFSRTSLSVGTHIITARITDSDSNTVTRTRTITVTTAPNTPPTVSISSPGNGNSFVQGASISFSGSASDNEDGNLSTNIVWTSSRDGNIGSGAGFSRTSLSVGVHAITAKVTDSDSAMGSSTITLSVLARPTPPPPPPPAPPVPNTEPTIVFSAPVEGKSYRYGSDIFFSASANDSEDGDIGSNIEWSSNLNGIFGNGASFSVDTLNLGTHMITASITDSDGAKKAVSRKITVSESLPTTPPTPSTGSGGSSGSSGSGGGSMDSTWLLLLILMTVYQLFNYQLKKPVLKTHDTGK